MLPCFYSLERLKVLDTKEVKKYFPKNSIAGSTDPDNLFFDIIMGMITNDSFVSGDFIWSLYLYLFKTVF